MTTAPAAEQRKLLAVQQHDTRLRQLEHQHRTLPVLAQIAALDSELRDVEEALTISRTEAGDLRRELAKAEADVEQVAQRAARDQARLDAGGVSAKDAHALSQELESLARRQGALEEIQLEVMERLEAHQDAVRKLEEAQAKTQTKRAAAVAERDQQAAQIVAEHRAEKALRTKAAEGVSPELLALYVKSRDTHDGLAVGALQGRRCGACRMEIDAGSFDKLLAAPDDEVLRCPECGRILVRTAD